MNCTACGTQLIQRSSTAKAPYLYHASGLSNVFLSGITVHACPLCKTEAPIIPRVGELHRAIADILSRKTVPLAGSEIRFLRKNIGIAGKKLAAVLGITPETLSRVENGKQSLRPGLEHLVRLMGRAAAGGETMREAVLEVADLLEGQRGEKGTIRPIQLKPDRRGGWKAAA